MRIVILCLSLLFYHSLLSQLPKPDGSFCVGKWVTEIIDQDRQEVYTPEDSNDLRKLVITAWYPSICEGDDAPYIHPEILAAHKDRFEIADTVDLKFIIKTKSHAYINPKISRLRSKYPVILFSHGSGTPTEFYTGMLTHMASKGYVVFAISHTYNAAAVQFPNGEIIWSNSDYFDNRWTEEIGQNFDSMMTYVKSDVTNAEKLAKINQLYQTDFPASSDMDYWAQDIRLALQYIFNWNQGADHKFYRRLNIKKVGGFGHSYGGSAMVHSLVINKNLKAAINLDGWQFGIQVPGRRMKKPTLYVRGGYENPDALNTAIYSNAGKHFSQIKVVDTQHPNFSDLPLFEVPAHIFKVGPISGHRNHQVMCEIVRSYFDFHLKKDKKAWRALEENFPEAQREY